MSNARNSRFPVFAAPVAACNLPPKRQTGTGGPRILIIRTKANGDILMGTPLLAALREKFPNAHLTWMVETREREAIDANPYVDEILLWDTHYWKNMTRRGLYPIFWWRVHALKKRLASRHYDILISFEPEDWPFLISASGVERSIGVFDTFREYHNQTKTSKRAALYTHAFTYEELPPHRTHQYLLPLLVLGYDKPATSPPTKMTIGYQASDEAAAENFLRQNGVGDGQRFVVIAPMTGWPSRIWPGERFAAVADALLSRYARENLRVVLIGSGKEKNDLLQVAAQMQAKTPPVIAAGSLSFRQMAALIARAALVIGGDSGPMHVAASVDTPYIALFGPSPVARFAPLSGRGLPLAKPVPCGPCHQFVCPNKTPETIMQCLRLISVEQVSEAAFGFLDNTAPRPARDVPFALIEK